MNLQRVDYEPRKAVKMIKSDPKKKYRRLFKKPTKVIKIFISIIMNPVAIYYVLFQNFSCFVSNWLSFSMGFSGRNQLF